MGASSYAKSSLLQRVLLNTAVSFPASESEGVREGTCPSMNFWTSRMSRDAEIEGPKYFIKYLERSPPDQAHPFTEMPGSLSLT